MFQQLLNLLPHEPGSITVMVAIVGSLVGLGLWLAGARFSRPILTLTAVALGTGIGMKLPQWCGWSMDPMAPAVGMAFVLGLSAFALHRFWVGLWLGLVVAAWASLAVWGILGHNTQWQWPTYHASEALPKYLSDVWQNLPNDMRKWLPLVLLASMSSGVVTALVWPKMGILFLWSAAGTSLILSMGSVALRHFDPAILARLPHQLWSQLAVLGGFVLIGSLLQWRLTSNLRPKSAAPRSNSSEKQS